MDYTAETLRIPATEASSSVFARVSAEQAGWQHLNMVALSLATGQTFGITIEQYEYIAIILGGVCDVRTSRGDFLDVGRRPDVFTGMPYALYMPRDTEFEIEALTDDFAMASCWVPTSEDHPITLITPDDVTMSINGGGQATHQVNTLIGEGFDCQRLTVREIYIPGGNSYPFPPHKHDSDSDDEADLEELCFLKSDRPYGYATQRIYTDADAANPFDVTLTARHNDIVLIPRGYHTMSSAPGFTTYALSVTAGSAPTLSHKNDKRYTWIEKTWLQKDSRLPVVDHGMEP